MKNKITIIIMILVLNIAQTIIIAQPRFGDGIILKTKVKVSKLTGGFYQYKYNVRVNSNSLQPLYSYTIEIGINDLDDYKNILIDSMLVRNWGYSKMNQLSIKPQNFGGAEVTWIPLDTLENNSFYDIPPPSSILPGDSIVFSLTTKSLPIIKRFWAQGWYKPYTEDEVDSLLNNGYSEAELFRPWYSNATTGFTLCSYFPSIDLSHINFLDTLITNVGMALELNWISNIEKRNIYLTLLSSARTSLMQNDSLLARTYLEKILRDVDIDSSSAITNEAYALLRYNTEYLLSKLPIVTEPTNDLSAKVSAEITNVNGMLQYTYTITNQAASNQAVANIYVEDKTTSTTTAPLNWQTEKVAATLDRFYTTTNTNQITAGTTQSGYAVTSNSVPVIAKVYVQSERYRVDTTDIKTNSYKAATVVPAVRPAQINASAFIDTLISYNNRSYTLGWMQYYWVRDNNYYQLNNAKTMINMNIPSSAVIILTAFEGWLDTIKNLTYINNEGYGLLKYNSIFLGEKLSGQ